MRWIVKGAVEQTGDEVTKILEAPNRDEAEHVARRAGILWMSIEPEIADREPPPLPPAPPVPDRTPDVRSAIGRFRIIAPPARWVLNGALSVLAVIGLLTVIAMGSGWWSGWGASAVDEARTDQTGLGVPYAQIINGLGEHFVLEEQSKTLDGTPRVLGRRPGELDVILVQGPANDPVYAHLVVAFTDRELTFIDGAPGWERVPDRLQRSALIKQGMILVFARNIDPTMANWASDAGKQARRGPQSVVATRRNGRKWMVESVEGMAIKLSVSGGG